MPFALSLSQIMHKMFTQSMIKQTLNRGDFEK